MNTIKGNLVTLAKEGRFDVIVHGCNCFNTMGSGIAPQIANAFAGPNGPREVDNTTVPGSHGKLGSCTVASYVRDDYTQLFIINAYTQYGTASKPGEIVVNYDAVRSCFANIADMAREDNFNFTAPCRIAYPAIGAGLAGGDWDIISKIIDEELEGLDHILVEYDGS